MQKLLSCKKYFFLNLLSLLGYFALFVFLLAFLLWMPGALQYGSNNLDPDISYTSIWVFLFGYSFFHTVIAILLLCLTGIEYFLRKHNKWFKFEDFYIPAWLDKIHSFLFYLGIVIVLMPVVIAIFVFISSFF